MAARRSARLEGKGKANAVHDERAERPVATEESEPNNPVTADDPEPAGSSNPVDAVSVPTEGSPVSAHELWDETHGKPSTYVVMGDEWVKRFVDGYQEDVTFRTRWDTAALEGLVHDAALRFVRDRKGLLFFCDADFQPRLCVPKTEQARVLREMHESPFISAHAGPEKLWEMLSQRFYWPRMKKDVLAFCSSCDVCQKTKPSNFSRFGRLTPNFVPTRPYESISMDMIVNLPWSEEFNAILVFVDRLSKHATFIPTTTGLNAAGFATLFVKHIACRYGLPSSMISDRDPRWTSQFWKDVAHLIRTEMLLSSSHHPQHDGQTEIVNRQLEVMLRAYVAEDRASWARWLPLLEHAYNSRSHASTGCTPYFLLYGFEPRTPLDVWSLKGKDVARGADAAAFADEMRMHRENARRAIARAQVKQAESYNRGRRTEEFEIGEMVLLNPHSLEWVESKGEGAKLVQRWIGPFEVTQRINANSYRLRLPLDYPGSPVFHLHHLKRYRASPLEYGERTIMPSTRALKTTNDEYEVEAIVGHRYDKRVRGMRYLVRWVGHSPLYDSWLTARDLRNAPDLLADYRKRHDINRG